MEGWCQDVSGLLCLLGKGDGTGAWLPERASRGGNDLEGQGRQCGGRKGAWGGHTWCWGRGPGAGLLGVRFEPLLGAEHLRALRGRSNPQHQGPPRLCTHLLGPSRVNLFISQNHHQAETQNRPTAILHVRNEADLRI